MNILLVTEYLPTGKRPVFQGGVQARSFFVSEYLRKINNLRILNSNAGSIEASSISLLRRALFAIRVMLSPIDFKPDIIEASNTTTYFPAFILAKRLQVPVVAWVPDILGKSWLKNFSLPVAVAGYLAERLSMALSFNHFIAMSQATRKKLANLGVNEKDVTVIYGGVEFAKMNKDRGEKDVRPTIISISRLLKYKRLSDLVRAVAEVKKNHPSVRCLIIGEGPEENNLKVQITKHKLQKNVFLLGNMPHDEAMVRLKRAHLFCLPSVVEGFGLVTVEAMAAGVPFVSAGIPATREITENGKGGLLFEPENVNDLAKKLNMLLDDKILYEKKIQEGLKLAKRYDWAIIAKQTEAVYRKAIASH